MPCWVSVLIRLYCWYCGRAFVFADGFVCVASYFVSVCGCGRLIGAEISREGFFHEHYYKRLCRGYIQVSCAKFAFCRKLSHA